MRAAGQPCPRCGWQKGHRQAAPDSDEPAAQQQRLVSTVRSASEDEHEQLSLKLRVTTASAPANAGDTGSSRTTADAASQCSAGSCVQVQEPLPRGASDHAGDASAAAAADAVTPAETQPQQIATAKGSTEAASAMARAALQQEVDRAAAAGQAAEVAASAKMSALQDAIRRLGNKSDLQQVWP